MSIRSSYVKVATRQAVPTEDKGKGASEKVANENGNQEKKEKKRKGKISHRGAQDKKLAQITATWFVRAMNKMAPRVQHNPAKQQPPI